MIYMKLSKT